MRPPVRMTPAQRQAFEVALQLQNDLDPLTQVVLESHLTAYRDRHQFSAGQLKHWHRQKVELVATARRLLALIPRASREDFGEAIHRESRQSKLQELLTARLAQWEAEALMNQPRAARPKDRARRILLWRTIPVFDDLIVKPSWHRDGARVLALREVLRLADLIDRRTPSSGSLRLIRDISREYQDRESWDPLYRLGY